MNITLANGTVIKAADVRPGMMLLSYNLETGSLQPSEVSFVYSLNATNKYTFNHDLQVDNNEIMLINGTWQRAYTAKVGDYLFDALTGKNITITSINITYHGGRVYDFIGTPVNNYIANGFLIDKDSSCDTLSLCSSFLGNETIELANGTAINVSSAAIGMEVMGYNFKLHKAVPTTIVSMRKVQSRNLYIVNGVLELDGGESVILYNGTNIAARDLRVGDVMYSTYGGRTVVKSITKIYGIYNTYDIDTAPTDDFIINGYAIS